MADIPTRLRRARERAKLEITDISARTKIKPAFIAAMERGEFDRLPGNFFTRAFLKAYAAEVGLDPRGIARQFDESCGRVEPITLEELTVVLEQKQPPHVPFAQRAAQQWESFRASPAGAALSSFRAPRPAVIAILALLVVIGAVMSRTPASARHEPGAVGTSGVVEAAPAAAPAPAPADKLTMAIRPTAQIWVTAKADGEPAIFRMLQPGEEVTVTALRDLTFRIGNAVAFQYTINGAPGKPLGGPDEVKEFQITRDNYRSYAR